MAERRGLLTVAYKAHSHSVVAVALDLAALATGTTGREDVPDYKELRGWLAWRVNEGWEPTVVDRWSKYEESVREMAKNALAMFDADEETLGVTGVTGGGPSEVAP